MRREWILCLFLISSSTQAALPLRFDGRLFADSVTARIVANEAPVFVRINRAEYFILSAHMFVGGASEALGYKKTVEGDIEITWAAGDKSPGYQLYRWLLNQPDNSITPDAYLMKAVELCKGDIFRALNIGLDLLIVGRYDGAGRNYYTKTQKLIDIRGDRDDLEQTHRPEDPSYRWTSKADNFSAWYHFWATMIYAFFRQSTFTLLPLPGHVAVAGMVLVEEFIVGPVEHVLRWEWRAFLDLPNRLDVDLQGARAGYYLARNLEKLNKGIDLKWQEQPYLLKRQSGCEASVAELRSAMTSNTPNP